MPITDLRTALGFLQTQPGELETYPNPVQADCEAASIYAHKAGGIPVRAPTKQGPAILFDRVMPANRAAAVGVFGSRQRCASYLGTTQDQVAERLIAAAKTPIAPIHLAQPPVQDVVQSENIDLSTLPNFKLTSDDAGAYITLGLSMAKDPDSEGRNISVHRLCVQGPDTLTIWMVPGRHLESFYLAAKAQGKALPIAIHIGLDPAIYMASCCPSPLVPLGFNELDIASSLRGRAYEISPCINIDADCISHAEYVLEGEITDEIIPESESSKYSMPEFLGYNGKVHPGLPVVKIKTITHRNNPIYQTVIGPGLEQSNLLGFGLEAAILDFLRNNVTNTILNAYCSTAGGGYLLLFLQFRKQSEQHDGVVKQAALAIFGVFKMIKQVVLVDDDVDVFSEQDVWWAMTTRFQADIDLITLSNVQGFPLDPTQNPDYSPSISSPGLTAKAVFDCTVPYRLKDAFRRVDFL